MIKSFKFIFYLSLIGLLLTGIMTTKDSFLLKTARAPMGIISMELAPTHQQQLKILKEWDSVYINYQQYSRDTVITGKITALNTANKQIKADYSFIFFYMLFLSLLYYKFRDYLSIQPKKNNIWLILVMMTFLAGVFDMLENSQILMAIHNYTTSKAVPPELAIRVFLPAVLKFILLILAISFFFVKIKALSHIRLWLQKSSALLKKFIEFGWKYRIVISGLILFFLFLTVANQGQDLLVTINTSDWGIFWFFSITTALALLNWYLPKIYDKINSDKLKKNTQTKLEFLKDKKEKLDFARLLGAITFLIPATGVLITMQTYHISYLAEDISPMFLLIVCCIFYENILRYHWLDRIYKPNGLFSVSRYVITLLIIISVIIILGRTEQTRAPYYLAYLSLGFFLLSFVFVVTASYRTSMPEATGIAIGPYVLGAGLAISLLFFAFNFEGILFFMTKSDRFYALPVVIAALVAYTMLFSFLLILGKRTGIQFITIFLLLVVYRSVTSINDFHQVYLVPKPANQKQNIALRPYINQWLESRKLEIAAFNTKYPEKEYPIFFVNAYGGGIKATAWTTMVIGRLDQLLRENNKYEASKHDFQHYVFSYSGASGGTIGLSLLCAARLANADEPVKDTIFYPAHSLKIYQHDFLTPNLVGLLGRDALMSLIGQNWYVDRARLQEINWENYIHQYGIAYATHLGAGWTNPKHEVPLFFSNTYDINTGYKGVLAPVILDKKDFPGTLLLQDFIGKNQDVHLSTAAFISARFPYVSPTAKFDEHHHFTDGGTLENSGAETSFQIFTVFKSVLDSLQTHDDFYKNLKIKINFLSLPNSVPVMDSVQRIKNLYEPLAPALGILNSTIGNTLKADTVIRYQAKKNNWNYFSINPTLKKIKVNNVWPVLPLGWQISDYALQQMELSITDRKSAVYQVLKVFPMYKPVK